jgi:hypothetical protein
MYLVLIGDSGIPRKSTSVAVCTDLVRRLYGAEGKIGVIDARMTPEQLELILNERTIEHDCAQMIVTISELAAFMGTESYGAGMPALLTDLYDCPDVRHGGGTIARGETFCKNVWLSFLSASTPIWLLKTVNTRVIEGGFSSRCIFVSANVPKQSIPWPDDTDTRHDRAALSAMLFDIKQRALDYGPIYMVPTAMELFRGWYADRPHSIDPYKQSFEAREDAHVLRVAALLSINDDSWEIQYKHMQIAIHCINAVKDTSGDIFERGIMRTKYAAAFDVVRTTLLSLGMDPIKRHVLTRKCRYWIQLEEFNIMLETMHDMKVIQRFVTHPERGRPAEWIRGTDKLLDRGVGEAVLERFA